MLAFNALAAAFALFMLFRHGPRALLFLAPGLVRARVEPPGPARSAAEQRAREALEALGFGHLGALWERSPLGGFAEHCEVFAGPGGDAFADVVSGGARVRFVSPCRDGAQLLTDGAPRPAIEGRGGRAAGLPGAEPAAAWAVHAKALAGFTATHGPAAAPASLDARLAAASAWRRGLGRRELRRLALVPFLNAVLASAILAFAVKLLVTGLRT